MLIPALGMALQLAAPASEQSPSQVTSSQMNSQPSPTVELPGQPVPNPTPEPVTKAPQQPAIVLTLPAPVPAEAMTSVDQPQNPNVKMPSPAQPGERGIVVTGESGAAAGDPAQAINEQSYAVVQAVDDAVVKPAAMAYKNALPGPVRSGLRNFLSNLTEPVVFINYLLQLKPGKAAETVGRFALNTTLGVGGLVDVAKTKPFRLPRRVNGFANTFGYYGIGPGPYMFLPIVGPTTVRDLLGLGLDRGFLPAVVGSPLNRPEWVLAVGTLKSLDDRVEFDCELERQKQSSNAYNTAREFYLERRKAEIEALHGRSYTPKGYSLIEITGECPKTSAQALPKQPPEPKQQPEGEPAALPSPATP